MCVVNNVYFCAVHSTDLVLVADRDSFVRCRSYEGAVSRMSSTSDVCQLVYFVRMCARICFCFGRTWRYRCFPNINITVLCSAWLEGARKGRVCVLSVRAGEHLCAFYESHFLHASNHHAFL